jgi:SAM-dependent methyltransferase
VSSPASGEAIWNDVECGGYEADLPLWEELAEAVDTGAPIVELGCGTGRVTLHLARRGSRRAIGLDRDPDLVEAVRERGGEAVHGDVRDFDLGERFGLVLAPMQLIQLLGDAADRRRCLSCVAEHLRADGRAAFAIVERLPAPPADAPPPLPDVREVDGWIYSSLPLEPDLVDDSIELRRLRQTVSPEGELSEQLDRLELRLISAEELEHEAAAAGLHPAGRREIPATDAHVGSTIVLLGVAA